MVSTFKGLKFYQAKQMNPKSLHMGLDAKLKKSHVAQRHLKTTKARAKGQGVHLANVDSAHCYAPSVELQHRLDKSAFRKFHI